MTLKQLGDILIAKRREIHPKESAFAKMLDTSASTISDYESGRRSMSYKMCERYANAMGIELSIKMTIQETGEIIE